MKPKMQDQIQLSLETDKHYFRVFGRCLEFGFEGEEMYICENEEEAKSAYVQQYPGHKVLEVWYAGEYFEEE